MKQSFSDNVKTFGGRLAMASALALTIGASSAMACSLANWSSVSGGFIANQPDAAAGDPVNSVNVPRYAELCGSQAPAGAASFVQDIRPGALARIIARFYVFNNGATNPQVYGGFSDTTGGGQLFDVTYSGTDIVFTSGGASVTDAGQPGWNSVEIDWSSGAGISMIVNGNPAVTGTGAATGSLSAVRLGNLNGAAGGPVNFDGYESHLSTPVGRFIVGDADGSGAVSGTDISAIVAEFLSGTLAIGTPDCNEDGAVGGTDISCVVSIFLGT